MYIRFVIGEYVGYINQVRFINSPALTTISLRILHLAHRRLFCSSCVMLAIDFGKSSAGKFSYCRILSDIEGGAARSRTEVGWVYLNEVLFLVTK